jgi:hypothetical protein
MNFAKISNNIVIMLSVEEKMAVKTARCKVEITLKIFGLEKMALAFLLFDFYLVFTYSFSMRRQNFHCDQFSP